MGGLDDCHAALLEIVDRHQAGPAAESQGRARVIATDQYPVGAGIGGLGAGVGRAG